jgi:hypothetical protein
MLIITNVATKLILKTVSNKTVITAIGMEVLDL